MKWWKKRVPNEPCFSVIEFTCKSLADDFFISSFVIIYRSRSPNNYRISPPRDVSDDGQMYVLNAGNGHIVNTACRSKYHLHRKMPISKWTSEFNNCNFIVAFEWLLAVDRDSIGTCTLFVNANFGKCARCLKCLNKFSDENPNLIACCSQKAICKHSHYLASTFSLSYR